MAGSATPEENESLDADYPNPLQAEIATRAAEKEALDAGKDARDLHRQRVMETAAKLYGQGFNRPTIAKMLVEHIGGDPRRSHEKRIKSARATLIRWERTQDFRDMIYNLAVVKLDLQTPAILGGVARKAKRGRVDAARLALEITGRHNPKGEQAATQVAIVFAGVPRPGTAKAVEAIEITAEDEEEV